MPISKSRNDMLLIFCTQLELFSISAINVLKRALFPQFDKAKDTSKEIANKEIVRNV